MRLALLAALAGFVAGALLPLFTNEWTWTQAAQQACAAAFSSH